MIGEGHSSKKLERTGRALENRMERLKSKNFLILVEGPFPTLMERMSLYSNIMFAPTAEFLRLFRRMGKEEYGTTLLEEEKSYLEERGLEKFRANTENIESPAFLLLPRILKIGLLEKIDNCEKEFLETFSRLMKSVAYNWKDITFTESTILGEYIDALDLTIKLRTSLNYTEGRLPQVNILHMSEDSGENKRILSKFPPDMYDDMMLLLSKISYSLRSRSILHAERITEVAERKMHDLIVTVTGAGHVPDVLELLVRGLFDEREAVFTDGRHEEYSRHIKDPEVTISYL